VAGELGASLGEDDVVDSGVVFMMTRFTELIFEVLPEVTLQLYVMFKTGEISLQHREQLA